MQRWWRSVCCAILLGGLAACAQVPVVVPADGFAANGKVNIRQDNHSDTALFGWVASPDRDVLTLSSPLGTTLAELTLHYQDGQVIRAQLDRGTQLDEAANPEALLQDLTGLALPVSGMRWWLRGLPAPSSPFESLAEHQFAQNGWTIVTSDYRDGPRPYRIELQRDALRVRVVINEWIQSTP